MSFFGRSRGDTVYMTVIRDAGSRGRGPSAAPPHLERSEVELSHSASGLALGRRGGGAFARVFGVRARAPPRCADSQEDRGQGRW